jgi:hypothetical protein
MCPSKRAGRVFLPMKFSFVNLDMDNLERDQISSAITAPGDDLLRRLAQAKAEAEALKRRLSMAKALARDLAKLITKRQRTFEKGDSERESN